MTGNVTTYEFSTIGKKVSFRENNGGYTAFVHEGEKTIMIPLCLCQKDIENSIKKLVDLDGKIDDISFNLFRDTVVGALLMSMKYGS